MDKKVYEKISEQLGEAIVEWRRCRWCGEEFAVYEGDKKLLDKISPVIGGEKFDLPLPTLCPHCRQRRRQMFRNERKLYIRNCDKCGKKIISMYPSEYEGRVYCTKCWWENADQYKIENIDVENIWNQFKDLLKNVAKQSLLQINCENSDYTNHSSYVKDCYLSFNFTKSEKAHYVNWCSDVSNSIDVLFSLGGDLLYQLIDGKNNFKVFFSQFVDDCTDIYFCFNCKGTKDSILCANKNNFQYGYKNKRLSKEEYQKIKEQYIEKIKSYKGLRQIYNEYKEFINSIVHKFVENINSNNVIGNYVFDSENIVFGFNIFNAKDIRYCYDSGVFNDSMDVYEGFYPKRRGEKIYESHASNDSIFGIVLNKSYECTLSSYIFDCFNLNSCFLCSDLVNSQYSILNKEYSRQEWENLVKKIIKKLKDIGKRGEFFDPILSPFPYNDTVAMEYHPVKELKEVKVTQEVEELIDEIFEEGILRGDKADKLRKYLEDMVVNSSIIDDSGEGIVYVLEPEKFISKAIMDLGGEELIAIKWRTKEKEVNVPEGIELIKAEELPDDISKMTKEEELRILKGAIICEESGRPFRIIKPELEFYKKYGIALPRKHPDIRHKERLKLRPRRELYIRNCDKCGKEILSVYSEDVEFKVYCQECYDKEVV